MGVLFSALSIFIPEMICVLQACVDTGVIEVLLKNHLFWKQSIKKGKFIHTCLSCCFVLLVRSRSII